MKIASELYSLAEIVNENPQWNFNIPIYQRLYVWDEDQVLTLLNDLVNAYERGEDLFFLGGTLLVEQVGATGRHFDLIDGQQRFTTLWLLCHAWRGALAPFLTVTENISTQPRLRFAIRPEVNRFLEDLIFGEPTQPIADDAVNKRMRTALDLMKSVFGLRPLPTGVKSQEVHLVGLTKFVFDKVKLVITTVPLAADLNKLFEVTNNRGVQLQHHEILKARMLDSLSELERGPYNALWVACADMDDFIERNLIGNSPLSASDVTRLYERDESDKLANSDIVFRELTKQMQDENDLHAWELEEILDASDESLPSESHTEEDADRTWVRSIFGFPLFLQHTLRIWLLESGRPDDLPRLLDQETLKLFEEHFFLDGTHRPENVRSFIKLLWRLRVIFDEHIIKWIDQGEEKVHMISNISVSPSDRNRYMNRSRDKDSDRAFSLLRVCFTTLRKSQRSIGSHPYCCSCTATPASLRNEFRLSTAP